MVSTTRMYALTGVASPPVSLEKRRKGLGVAAGTAGLVLHEVNGRYMRDVPSHGLQRLWIGGERVSFSSQEQENVVRDCPRLSTTAALL